MSQGKAQAILIGNLTRDPETRTSSGGMAITRFTVAVSTKFKDKEETAFIDCTAFAKSGEAFAKYHRKGARCIIFGRIVQENWDDKATGAKRSKLAVIVDDWQFAGGERQGESGVRQQSAPMESTAADNDVPF